MFEFDLDRTHIDLNRYNKLLNVPSSNIYVLI